MPKRWHISTSCCFLHKNAQKKHLLDMTIAKHSASGNWKKKRTQEVACFFDLFNTSGREKGWDPSSSNSDYIVWCFRSKNTPAMLMPFLSRSNSRKETNCNNTKATGGYKWAASEWFVCLFGASGDLTKCILFWMS